MNKLLFGSLFTGIGGFDLGFERAGLTCAWQNDLYAPQGIPALVSRYESDLAGARSEKTRRRIERKWRQSINYGRGLARVADRHWAQTLRINGVRNVTIRNASSVNIICGGFPCQDVSIAKAGRAGLDSRRSGLWWEFYRVVSEFLPQWVVIENVPGLFSSNGGRDFAAIIRALGQRGYYVSWRVFDSQYFGVAQRRRRVFIIGSLGDGRCAEVLFESEGGKGHFKPRQTAQKNVAGTLTRSFGERGGATNAAVDSNLLTTFNIASQTPAVAFPFRLSGHGEYTEGVGTLRAQGGDQGGGSETLISQAVDTRNFTLGKDGLSGTLAAKGSGGYSLNFQNPVMVRTGVRRLTPTECERLQGFPDGFTDVGNSDSLRYQQLGNAVTVAVAEWIGRRILAVG